MTEEAASVRNISPDLVEKIDVQVGKAINDVNLGRCQKAQVGIAFDVGLDDEGKPVVTFTHKHSRVEKGSWEPARQERLPLEGLEPVSVTFRGGDFDVLDKAAAILREE